MRPILGIIYVVMFLFLVVGLIWVLHTINAWTYIR